MGLLMPRMDFLTRQSVLFDVLLHGIPPHLARLSSPTCNVDFLFKCNSCVGGHLVQYQNWGSRESACDCRLRNSKPYVMLSWNVMLYVNKNMQHLKRRQLGRL